MLIVAIPWASGVLGLLPFVGVLAPSERYAASCAEGKRKMTEWAWQSCSWR